VKLTSDTGKVSALASDDPGRRAQIRIEVAMRWSETLTIVLLVVLALGLRLAYYLINPSFSVDESALTLNLLHGSYDDLGHQLNFNQAAPLGFLILQKMAIDTLGSSEHVLRLLPLASALLASLLFYPVASKFVGRKTALLALALFAVSEPLLFYAATMKQYSIDVAVALALYAIVLSLGDSIGRREALALGFVGAVAVWLSHPAIFILAGFGSVFVLASVAAQEWARLRALLVVSALWLASFAGSYVLTRSSLTHLQQSISTDPAAVLTARGGSGRLASYGGTIRELFGIPHFGLVARNGLALIGVFLCAVGFGALLVRSASRAALLLVPALYVVLASAVGKYPLYPRTLLFLVPGLLILAANGVRTVYTRGRPRVLMIAAACAFLTLFTSAAVAPANHLRFREGGELKQAMRYLARSQKPGDSLYVYPRAQYDLRYYLECGCFSDRETVRVARALWPLRPAPGTPEQWAPAMRSDPPRLIIGTSTSAKARDYRSDIAPLRGQSRVWILLAAAPTDSRRALRTFLDRIGAQKDAFHTRDDVASVYLYDLSH
jgi:hypothetical protein